MLTSLFLSLFLLRSSDYGTTYSKLNLMPGTTIVVSNFYICPINKKKVGSLQPALSIFSPPLTCNYITAAISYWQLPLPPLTLKTIIVERQHSAALGKLG
jgi:hypothetical protein